MKYRQFTQNQLWLIPPDIEEEIPANDIAHTINDILDQIDMSTFDKRYKEEGNVAYSPKIMLKVLLYSYYNKIFSSRKIAKELERNIVYWYLSGKQRPNFRTICKFIVRHEEEIRDVFVEVVKICKQLKMIGMKNFCIDGTSIEANASKDNHWSLNKAEKALVTEEKMIATLIKEAIKTDKAEDKAYGKENRGEQIIPEKLKERENRVKKIREAIIEIKKNPKRKTYNTTDPDSHCLGKEKGMIGYNAQIIADEKNQIIVSAGINQEQYENAGFKERLSESIKILEEKPQRLMGDAAYSCIEIAKELKNNEIEGIIPDRQIKEIKKEIDGNRTAMFGGTYSKSLFKYEAEKDVYICPAGKELRTSGNYLRKRTKNNKLEIFKRYKNITACKSCEYLRECTKSKTCREILRQKDEAYLDLLRTKIRSDEGYNLYKKRMKIVEPVFGNIKWNKGFRKFNLRGIKKANAQFLIMCCVHNIEKIKNAVGDKYHGLKAEIVSFLFFIRRDFIVFAH